MPKLNSPIVYAEFIQPHHMSTTFRVKFRTIDGKRYVTPEYPNNRFGEILDHYNLFDASIRWEKPRWFAGNEDNGKE